ncbi:MAG TPA: hypothetical protein IGS53_24275 [Leptolyngbyaceae cyanobacterium M33_DOE_097]|uniref:Tetratricopeptide repeat protein n=1 Tax=Oscillatoriales cyanobacterium SpSt-418 TaxID=2282169 RepID=A0A7C3KIB3_9CYAN|nr:hypothetical protein [Leptolyngbyaceae cyanobacterium M33_DOE_097]
MLEKIVEAVEVLQDPNDRAEVYIAIAKQFNLLHQSEQAILYVERTLQEVTLLSVEAVFTSNSLKCKAASQLAKAGLHSRGTAMLTEALQQADGFEDAEDRDYILLDVAEAYAEIGMYDSAIQIGLLIDDDYNKMWRLFDPIAVTAILQHRHEEIFNMLAALDDSWERNHFLLEAANTYSSHKQPERAISLISSMTCASSQAEALAKLVKECNEIIPQAQSLDLLHQAEVYAVSVEDIDMQAQALRKIAEQYIQLKQFTQARSLLEQAKQRALSVNVTQFLEQVPHDVVLDGIARAFSKLPEYEATAQIADAMTDPILSVLALLEASKDSAQANISESLKTQILQELSAIEAAIAEEYSNLADLKRVRLAEVWSELERFDRVQAIAEQIEDPGLKALALQYAGIGVTAFSDLVRRI